MHLDFNPEKNRYFDKNKLGIGKLGNWWIDVTNKIKDKTDTMIPSQETHQSLWVEAVEAVSFPLTKINSSYMFLLAFPLGNERVVTSKSNLPTCTDKRTDVWSRNFMIWKMDFGLWAVVWAGLWKKGVGPIIWAFFEARFFTFSGSKKGIPIRKWRARIFSEKPFF